MRPHPPRRGHGICAIRGDCGKKGIFGQSLPCPDDGDAEIPSDETRELLRQVCGPAWTVPDTVCCTPQQITTLRASLAQAEPLVASCPACRNNFRKYHCEFTCSSDQSLFLNVVSTQQTDTRVAVQEVAYYVDEQLKQGFFDSCKDVQFGATNGFAMDLIGGGATNASAFLKFMGDYRPGLGSPFQISIPDTTDAGAPLPEGVQPLAYAPLDCADNDLAARCTCVDCPRVCPALPYVPPPSGGGDARCTVGAVSCLTFTCLILYSVGILAALVAYSWRLSVRHRQRRYERLALVEDAALASSDTRDGADADADRGNMFNHHAMTASSPNPTSPAERHHPHHADPDGAHPLRPDADASSHPSQSSRFRLGRGASLLDPIDQLQPRQNRLSLRLRAWFYRLGWRCANDRALTFAIAAVVIALLNIGWRFFAVETDPVRLWVSPGSESARQKAYFDDHFGPFYRPQQVFVMPSDAQGPESPGVLSYETLDWWLTHERAISELRSSPNNYTLQDVCFAPAGEGSPCVVQSISAWLGTDMSQWPDDAWADRVTECAERPSGCLPDFGQPIDPKLILGGTDNLRWTQARAMVSTWVIDNSLDPAKVARAEEWERTLEAYIAGLAGTAHEAGLRVAYSTGVSLEQELNKSTNTDVKIVVLSYLVMFLYVSLTLGGGIDSAFFFGQEGLFAALSDAVSHVLVRLHLKRPSASPSPERKRTYMTALLPTLLSVNSKFLLGLFGICIVLIAVASSVGLFSLLGVRVTLIIAEVIPFLVLAVGVDNVFILVHELDRQNGLHGPGSKPARTASPADYDDEDDADDDNDSIEDEMEVPSYLSAEERVARTVARMGPSILLSSVTEVIAFGLGALVPMPAVRNFALYAAGSVLLGAVLQLTIFVSAMTWDLKRTEDNRMDCFPCIRLRPAIALYDVNPNAGGEGVITRIIRKYYAPNLLRREIKQLVLILFGGLLVTALVGIQRITLGLDQRLALPSDSYLVDYFDAVDSYLDVGPPVYFVVQDSDINTRHGQQQLCGRFTTCMELSVANSLEAERKRPESSFIANPPASWVDDFLHWTDPVLDTCCRVKKADPSVFCKPTDPERVCRPCFADGNPPWSITMDGLPQGPEVMRYLQQWLHTPTDENCPLGGQAPYGSAVSFRGDNSSVQASHFRTYHTPLKTQDDFINALAAARRVSKDIQRRTGAKVFPYSLFYVFFDQYAHVTGITVEVLLLALVAILGVTSILLGSWRTGAVVTSVCSLAVLNVMGIMGFWHISLNAISLVNLVISLGIAVEFCSHIARAFMSAGHGLPYDHPSGRKERDERAYTALVEVGPSVFSGITMTKLIGISVLALTRSKLLEVYYFRMWLSLIVSGAIHGLILLPVVLSYAGGPGYSLDDFDEEWVSSAMRRPTDYEYAPFHDAESILSD
ncbi:hypothetical protein NliqN6_6014 [Naganishia liquefaciens]|uniref:SSD domain-containing protein n=1 Tax=Naganishia liquefaciens TaxID=104408 RepID=A0A8H3TYV0_9TREE|nr:hypothetical protein NliqN6_6014 [Naganishia liquefaciens]